MPAQAFDDVEISLAKVPEAVRLAAVKAVPGLKLGKAYMSKDAKNPIYELEGQDAKKQDYTVVLNSRAQVLEIDIAIALSAVPKAVLDALHADPKSKDVKFTDADKVTRGGKLISYRFEGKDAKGKDFTAYVKVPTWGGGMTVEFDEVEE